MKYAITTVLLLACLCAEAQNFPSSSNVDPTMNEFGDPVTNSVDPNGSQQGIWYYKDINQVVVFKEVYSDNLVESKAVFSPLEGHWIDLDLFIQNSIELLDLRASIINLLGSEMFNGDRLITVCKLPNGNIMINLFGSWQNHQEIETGILNLVAQLSLSNSSYVFIQ